MSTAVIRMALRNLLRKRVRTALSVVGLAVALALVVGLISFSYGLRALIDSTLRQVSGVLIVNRGAPHLVLSRIPTDVGDELAAMDGVTHVVPEVWHAAMTLNDIPLIYSHPETPALVIRGADLEREAALPEGGLFARAIVVGRYLKPGAPADGCVLSREIAGKLKLEVGGVLKLPDAAALPVVGLFETGSMLLDQTIVVPIEQARAMKGWGADKASCYYLELARPETREVYADAFTESEQAKRLELRAFSPEKLNQTASDLIVKLDKILLVITILPLLGAAAAVLNTMMMSFSERIPEFGVLKACGWRRIDVLGLVLVEALLIGVAGGLMGCAVGGLGTFVLGRYLAIAPVTPGWLYVTCVALALVLGAAGGAWPAVRAALLPPMEAIRRG